ncbi:MAG: hypothetical protein KW802_00960 [Candidatus Doudnabacteria bacterium]|nr:hypothetical protein [Candidatus Doudnabacteria bacterium]
MNNNIRGVLAVIGNVVVYLVFRFIPDHTTSFFFLFLGSLALLAIGIWSITGKSKDKNSLIYISIVLSIFLLLFGIIGLLIHD